MADTWPIPPAPAKASYAPYKVGDNQATGLCAALNLYYAEEARKRGGKSDIYEVQFLDPIISNASIVPPGPVDKALAGGNANANGVDAIDPNRQAIDPTMRIRSATAGQQIVQFIDEVIRGSRYISDQQIVTWEVDPVTQKGAWVPNGKANKVAISMAPTVWPTDKKGRLTDGQIKTDLWPLTPQITYDTKEYPATTYIEGGFVPSIVPIGPFGPGGVVYRY
jgi:hypothetical protein